ncbi:hypothetical protein KFZ56_02380 [Virgibacillus sp. NKC19-3]|uniref:DUF6944 family repetitive protein n=1 Tax=Virgibacillus saliphilus TaxID=2831674 RepID=UPI001C9A352F|nr:hypothetical protein [Virgibacillus sp. NKC19-3]MBY7141951.1 hypothetical protein [Virgibacillus sp. NKC19-3]
MGNRSKELVGAWIQAVGTTMSAVASTPMTAENQNISPQFYEDFSNHLDLWGNVLQSTGNALIADSEEGYSLSKVGNKVESTGNLVNVVGFLANVSEQLEIELNIKGELIQAVGGSLSLADTLNEELTEDTFYDIYGSLLQIIGNAMQNIAGIKELNASDSERIDAVGGWSQAIGSILSLIATIKSE